MDGRFKAERHLPAHTRMPYGVPGKLGERHMMFCESAITHAVLFAWKATGRKQLLCLVASFSLVPLIM